MMIISKVWTERDHRYLENKVTLRRLGAPLLYAYDACTFTSRLRGIHGVPPLGPTDALILRPCKAIHTFGLCNPIDVMFLNRNGVILKLASVRPGRVMLCWRGAVAVEMAPGTALRLGLSVGQQFVPSEGRWR